MLAAILSRHQESRLVGASCAGTTIKRRLGNKWVYPFDELTAFISPKAHLITWIAVLFLNRRNIYGHFRFQRLYAPVIVIVRAAQLHPRVSWVCRLLLWSDDSLYRRGDPLPLATSLLAGRFRSTHHVIDGRVALFAFAALTDRPIIRSHRDCGSSDRCRCGLRFRRLHGSSLHVVFGN